MCNKLAGLASAPPLIPKTKLKCKGGFNNPVSTNSNTLVM